MRLIFIFLYSARISWTRAQINISPSAFNPQIKIKLSKGKITSLFLSPWILYKNFLQKEKNTVQTKTFIYFPYKEIFNLKNKIYHGFQGTQNSSLTDREFKLTVKAKRIL